MKRLSPKTQLVNVGCPSEFNAELIIVVGDIHGKWETFYKKLTNSKIKNAVVILAGDVGIGFDDDKNEIKRFHYINRIMQQKKIILLAIRGNHDNPKWFDGSVNYSNFHLLPDYTYLTINGNKWGFVGGAISIDRRDRHLNKSYWIGEPFVLKEELIQPCNVLVCHSAPQWLGPINKLTQYDWDVTLEEDCMKERSDITRLVELSNCKRFYCGHFHMSMNGSNGNCQGTILAINEFRQNWP